MQSGHVGVVASLRNGCRILCAANRCVCNLELSSKAAVHSVHLYFGSLGAVSLVRFCFSAVLS